MKDLITRIDKAIDELMVIRKELEKQKPVKSKQRAKREDITSDYERRIEAYN